MLEAGPRGDGSLVQLRDAGKRYRWRAAWVLHAVDLEVERGCVVEVRGRNGAGKSTLFRMVAGATLPTRGRGLAATGVSVGYGPERLTPAPPFRAVVYSGAPRPGAPLDVQGRRGARGCAGGSGSG